MDDHYDIAIVTVSTNKLFESCLKSVRKVMDQSPLKTCFVLVDNGSTEFDAHAYCREHVPDARVILRHKNHGFGRSCNRGACEVSADYYFFLNPDTGMEDYKILDRLYAFMKNNPKVGIAAPRIRYMDGKIQETCRRFPAWFAPIAQRTSLLSKEKTEAHKKEFLMEDYNHNRRRMVDWVQGSAFMIDAKLYHEIGGFDDRYFMYYEDVDLCRSCWKRGRPVYYLPSAELFHEYGKESANVDGVVQGMVMNSKTRTHIKSWIKYTIKWFGE